MRVVEPSAFRNIPKQPKRKHKAFWLVLTAITIIGIAIVLWIFVFNKTAHTPVQTESSNNTVVTDTKTETEPKTLRIFSAEEFKELYRSMAYPNTVPFTDKPDITGTIDADARIRELAEQRGYKATSIPAGAIVKINEPRLDGDDLLQPLAATAWQSLKQSAQKDAVPLSIISAYRSPEYQKNLFMSRLIAQGVTTRSIVTNAADATINSVLSQAAIPGYSRHHTGYTIDLWCEDGSGKFINSRCFQWISANNYQKAKENGWIPSYPEGAEEQGPEPEPWEYVWVGTEVLYQ